LIVCRSVLLQALLCLLTVLAASDRPDQRKHTMIFVFIPAKDLPKTLIPDFSYRSNPTTGILHG